MLGGSTVVRLCCASHRERSMNRTNACGGSGRGGRFLREAVRIPGRGRASPMPSKEGMAFTRHRHSAERSQPAVPTMRLRHELAWLHPLLAMKENAIPASGEQTDPSGLIENHPNCGSVSPWACCRPRALYCRPRALEVRTACAGLCRCRVRQMGIDPVMAVRRSKRCVAPAHNGVSALSYHRYSPRGSAEFWDLAFGPRGGLA